MNMRVVNTLIKKDFKNCFSNKNLLASLAIPVGFCILYNYLFSGIVGLESTYVLQMCAIFAIAIVPTTILPVMIAEEKEKYTLRSLMLAKVSGLEFLAAKLEVCLTLTLIEALLVFFLAGGQRAQLPLYLLMVLLSTLGLSFLGAIAGLAAKDQASAGTVGAPLLLIALIPQLFSGLFCKNSIAGGWKLFETAQCSGKSPLMGPCDLPFGRTAYLLRPVISLEQRKRRYWIMSTTH